MSKKFLIEAQELQEDYSASRYLLLDARTPEAYLKGHLPGAVFLSTYGCFIPDSSPAGMQSFTDDVSKRYASIGVTHDKTIVVYEDATGMRAARELWILEFLGHQHVRMLHGGLQAWQQAGGMIDSHDVVPTPTAFTPKTDNSVFISAQEVNEGLNRTGRQLVDVRDANEYNGLDHTECCERRGHVPGAIWIEWTELLEHGKYKSAHAIRKILSERGISDQNELVPYCHRGARSANAYFAMRYAGYPGIRNFIGSMHEWSAQKAFEIER